MQMSGNNPTKHLRILKEAGSPQNEKALDFLFQYLH